MDLAQWITEDLESLHTKLFRGVLDRVPTEHWAEQVDGGGSSINHLLLHLARHQDLAITTAIRNHAPLFTRHAAVLGIVEHGPAAGLAEREQRAVTAALDPAGLLAYVNDVFRATDRWIANMSTLALDSVPATPRRLSAKAEIEPADAGWLIDMWAGKPVWWLLQWPVLGHGHTHVGELTSLRNRLGFSPF